MGLERPKLLPGYSYGPAIRAEDLRVGDVVVLQGHNISYAGISQEPIARLGRKNLVIVTEDRFGRHEYKVPRAHVTFAARGKIVHPVESQALAEYHENAKVPAGFIAEYVNEPRIRKGDVKMLPASRSYQDADWAWLRKEFGNSIDKIYIEVRPALGNNWLPALEQHFLADSLKDAQKYAFGLLTDGQADSVWIAGRLVTYFDSKFDDRRVFDFGHYEKESPMQPNHRPELQDGYAEVLTGRVYWQEAGEDDWEEEMLVPSEITGAKYLGSRRILDSTMSVFRLKDGRTAAQMTHMARNHKGLLNRNAGEHDYLVRREHAGMFVLYRYDGWEHKRGQKIGARDGYVSQSEAQDAANKDAVKHDVGDAVVYREKEDGEVYQIGNVGHGFRAGSYRSNSELPKPRRTVDTSLARVSRIEQQERQRQKPFDPSRRYPRDTKPHHFSVNPTDPRDVPEHLRPVRIGYVSSYETAPDQTGASVPYRVFENGEAAEGEPQWYEVEYAGGSDYSGGTVSRSNYKVLEEMLEEHHPSGEEPPVWVTAYGAHGTQAIFVVYDALDEDVQRTLGALEDYPVIDESALSELETEEEDEAWERWAQRDFERGVIQGVNAEYPEEEEIDDWPEDTDSYRLFEMAREAANEYWAHESEGPYINLKRIIPTAVALITGEKQPSEYVSQGDIEELDKIRKGFDLELPK